MHRLVRFASLSVLALALMLRPDPAAAAACEARVGWESYPPYAMKATDGTLTGYDLDMARTMLETLGCRVAFVEMPWTRAVKALEAGEIDLLTAATRTDERDAFAVFTGAYRDEALYLARPAGTPDFDLQTALGKGLRVGIVKDYSYGLLADRLIADPATAPRFDAALGDGVNLRKLEAGRIQMALVERITFHWLARDLGLAGRLVLSREPLNLTGLHFMVSKRSPLARRLTAMDAALATMQEDGRAATVLRRYVSTR